MAADTPDIADFDAQDRAEIFDETHVNEDADEFATFEDMPDVYDATQALGDGRDVRAIDAADFNADDLDDEDLEDDEDVDTGLDDDLEDDDDENASLELAMEGDSDPSTRRPRAKAHEAAMEYVADIDAVTHAEDDRDDSDPDSDTPATRT